MMTEFWEYYDTRTGKRVGLASPLTKELAETAIAEWRKRDARGVRPELHTLIPFLAARKSVEAPLTEYQLSWAEVAEAVSEIYPEAGQLAWWSFYCDSSVARRKQLAHNIVALADGAYV